MFGKRLCSQILSSDKTACSGFLDNVFLQTAIHVGTREHNGICFLQLR